MLLTFWISMLLVGLAGLAWSTGGPRMAVAVTCGLLTGAFSAAVVAFAAASILHPTEQEPVALVAAAAGIGILVGTVVGGLIHHQKRAA